MKKINYKDLFLDILYDIGGSILYAVGINMFTAPNQLAPGGVIGIATIINYFFPVLPIGTMTLIINIPLLVLGAKFVGKSFMGKTLKTLIISTIFMDYILAGIPTYTGNPLLAGLFGGVLIGTGLGIIIMRGSSTGGSDIVCRLVQLKFPYMKLGRLALMIDGVVLAASAVAFRDIELAMYALISVYVSTQMLDAVLYGLDKGKMAIIISDKSDEIANAIMAELDRGVTLLKTKGAYSQVERDTALCAIRRNEFYKVQKIILDVDPHAFIIVSDTSQVLGEGFKSIEQLT